MYRAICAVVLIVFQAPAAVAAQEGVQVTLVESCLDSCDLTLERYGEYGEDAGPGMIEASRARGWLDQSKRMYIAGDPVEHVQLFGPDGAFLRRIGGVGSGPGELEHVTSLVVVGDGLFSILDRRRGMILTFDWTGALRQETRPQGWFPRGIQTIHVGGSMAVHHANIRTPDLVGYPLHLVNLQSGHVEESFGSLTGEYDLQSDFNQVIARGPRGAVWLAEQYAYKIALWESNKLLHSLQRDVEWFPELPMAEVGHGWGEEPSTLIAAIAADDSLLWIAIGIADEQWEKVAEYRDRALSYDTIIEVVDWKRGRVVGTERFDGDYFHWVEPGLLGRLVVTSEGSLRYRTMRVRLVGR